MTTNLSIIVSNQLLYSRIEPILQNAALYTGFACYLENLKFCHLFFQVWIAWNLLKKSDKAGILTPNLKIKMRFVNSMFQDALINMSLPKSVIYIFVFSTLSHKHCDSKPN